MVPREDPFTAALQDVARDVLTEIPIDAACAHPTREALNAFVASMGRSFRRRGLKIATLTVVEADLRAAEREGGTP